MEYASFFCQNCGQAIHLDPSLLTKDTRGHLSQRLAVADKLFKTASKETKIEQPMCDECADDLYGILKLKLSDLKREREMVLDYVKKPVVKVDDSELKLLLEKESKSLELLQSLEKEEFQLETELKEMNHQLRLLNKKQEFYWKELNFMESEQREYQDKIISSNSQFEIANERLHVLKNSNVYHDTFKIWHDGAFGTINHLRLGRLPTKQVDWSEINAGLGQVALLLDSLAQKMKFTFSQYRIISMGSFSKIEKLSDKSIYELYGSSDFAGLFFANKRFDMGLVALITCIKEFGDELESRDGQFKLPYRIEKDKIGQISIKLGQDEEWTKALKYLLIDLKWLMSYCTTL